MDKGQENSNSLNSQPRVLVIKLSSMGDLFHTLPAVHCLKTGLNATIDWMTQTSYVDLVNCFSDVNRVIPFHRNAFFRNTGRFLRELRSVSYDFIVDFQGLWKSAIGARLARGRKRIGPSFHSEGSRLLYSSVAGRRNKNRHAVDENLDVIRYLQLPLLPPEFPVNFPSCQLVREPRPRVALIPFSRWPSKNWPVLSFVDVGIKLQDRLNASIFLMGGPDDVSACMTMAGKLSVVNMAGKISLVELAGVLREMDLVISNDSGPMHMAAALGTPVLAIFGPTDPVRTGPYGSGHRVIEGNLQCQPCFSRSCTFKDYSCLRLLTSEKVVSIALEMLTTQAQSDKGTACPS